MTIVKCVRCKFIKQNGQRCKRNTCIRKDYCWQHLRVKLGIDVRPSKLGVRAGKGLIAFKNFPKGSKVASYSGNIVPTLEAKDSEYAVSWTRGKVVDSNSTQNSVGRYANTCRGADRKRKKCKGNNVKMNRDFRRKHIKLKATKKIKKGDEIFNTYGSGFRIV
jgi:hypothetical protein